MKKAIYDMHASHIFVGLAAPLNVREGKVTDISMGITWDQADGNFQNYEVSCTNCTGTPMVCLKTTVPYNQ